MFARLGRVIARWPLWIVAGWILFTVALRLTAPNWNDVAHDGDLAHLPATSTSVRGERLLLSAFPQELARSQIVVVLSRDDGELEGDDIFVGYDIARRLKTLHAEAALIRRTEQSAQDEETAEQLLDDALLSSEDAVAFDDALVDRYVDRPDEMPPPTPSVFRIRARALRANGEEEFASEFDEIADDLQGELSPDEAAATGAPLPILDVWTWAEPVLGSKLVSQDGQCRLIVLQLSNELLATDNIRVLERIEREIDAARQFASQRKMQGLHIDVSGSAAVGADLLRSSRDMIRHTEIFSGVLVLLILVVVYRSPLLVLAPLVSIAIALLVSTSLVAALTQLSVVPGIEWFDVKIFTTTRIFVTVILFGAGTDYCLFIISRFREEMARGESHESALSKTLSGVGEALAASSFTTIVGLGMMAFADFGKYRHSGPVIGFCLVVMFLVCITLTPALLRLMGRGISWPWPPEQSLESARTSRVWDRTAIWILRWPTPTLATAVVLMAPFAAVGFWRADEVTYDLIQSLSPRSPSHRGAKIMERHFPVGESSPVTVLALTKQRLNDEANIDRLRELANDLYMQDRGGGVAKVRSIVDPLGDFSPGEKVPLLGSRAWRMRIARPNRRTEARFLAQAAEFQGRVARFELVLSLDPFSREAMAALDEVETMLEELAHSDPFWRSSEFHITGAAAGIRDLRQVTRRDNVRIEILVVLGVLAVLLAILRRPIVCAYLIASVLLSYYVTLGATYWFFRILYGDAFVGLDWRTPLFLFVILVAVGQDYNVYLATRVFEEQRKLGAREGLRRAIARTGGIITSCGVIMAGAFASMTSSFWAEVMAPKTPILERLVSESGAIRGITELGFALAAGVLLDTLVVRPILVPAFLALRIPRNAKSSD